MRFLTARRRQANDLETSRGRLAAVFALAGLIATGCSSKDEEAAETEIAEAAATEAATESDSRPHDWTRWASLVDGEWKTPEGITATDPNHWPMFRGNRHLTGVTASDLPENMEVLWSYATEDAIDSSAAIEGDFAYVGSFDGYVHAVDFETGEFRWKYHADAPVTSSPAVRDGRVFVGDDYGFLHAMDAETGEELWKFETGAEILSSVNATSDSQILFGSYDQFLYSLDAATGEENWKVETDGPVHCTPGLTAGLAFSSGCDGIMRMIDVANGVEVGGMYIGSYMGASPATRGRIVYAGNFDNTVMAMDMANGGLVWEYDPEPKDFPFYSSAAIAHDRIVLGSRDKMVHCIDIETGEKIWWFKTKARVESSPVIVGQRVFIGSSDGNLYELDLETGEERWRFTTGAPIIASPAVARGRLIVGDQDGILYCFGSKG